jgi:hypothetical protein
MAFGAQPRDAVDIAGLKPDDLDLLVATGPGEPRTTIL